MRIRTIRYTLAYEYRLPQLVRWHLAEGDLANVAGSYEFETNDEEVLATCRQEIDLGFWVPGPIRRIGERQALRDSVLEFKKEVERRRAARIRRRRLLPFFRPRQLHDRRPRAG